MDESLIRRSVLLNKKPTVNQLNGYTFAWNARDRILYGLAINGDGSREVVPINGTNQVSPLPPGGTTGQALVKLSSTDYDAGWDTVGGSGENNSTYRISGTVTWLGGLTFRLSVIVYKIWGQQYSTAEIDITLDAADPDLDRRDRICVDNTSTVIVLKGTAAEFPVLPAVDDFTQLSLTDILIPAGSTEPGGISNVVVYDENVEWQTTGTIADLDITSIDFESTDDPQTNDVCLKIEKTGEEGIKKVIIDFTTDTPVVLSASGTLSFYIYASEPWAGSDTVEMRMFRNGSPVGNPVLLVRNAYGNTQLLLIPMWRFIAIPLADFNAGGQEVDQLQFRFSYTDWGSIGNYIKFDNIMLQGGLVVEPPVVAGTEIIIPKLDIDCGGYRVDGDPYPIVDQIQASWNAYNIEFLKFNPEIWIYRRKTYTRKQTLTEQWVNDAIIPAWAGQLVTPVTDFTKEGDHILFQNNRAEFSSADEGECIYPNIIDLHEGMWYRIKFQVTDYALGAILIEFGTWTNVVGVGSIIFELQYHAKPEGEPFKLSAAYSGTTLNVDNVFVIKREREYSRKKHKKWTHEPHLGGWEKYPASNFHVGDISSRIPDIRGNGRHTEFECSIQSGHKIIIPVNPFEYYYGVKIDETFEMLSESSVWSDYTEIRASGRRKSLNIPVRFAITIDNPDTDASNPRLRGPLSDEVYMRVHAPINQLTGTVLSFRQSWQYSQSTRKMK